MLQERPTVWAAEVGGGAGTVWGPEDDCRGWDGVCISLCPLRAGIPYRSPWKDPDLAGNLRWAGWSPGKERLVLRTPRPWL